MEMIKSFTERLTNVLTWGFAMLSLFAAGTLQHASGDLTVSATVGVGGVAAAFTFKALMSYIFNLYKE